MRWSLAPLRALRLSAAARAMSAPPPLDTLIFDIDDTLYPVSSGFSDHRNGPVVAKFMTAELGFASEAEALELRDAQFREHHSTLKGLKVASDEGRLPKPFDLYSLGRYWAEHCDYAGHLAPNPALRAQLEELRALGYALVVFTNAPRAYGLRCLETLGVRDVFDDSKIFAVEDVMPACKPEAAAFEQVIKGAGAASPASCVMFEDSMKNVRACKALGMTTVFVDEARGAPGGEAALLGDARTAADDGAVDATVRVIADMKEKCPWLWARERP
mmetsp:Transcript_27441/g.82370  ORF Transcript_27441/g.82370 Transcript_27441/m.82370 type:complete len:273 (-) Transcript_27441:21-839(-)